MVAKDKRERRLQPDKEKFPQIMTCDRCGHKSLRNMENWHKGDPEWDEWLCESCWQELGELEANNKPIIDEIATEFQVKHRCEPGEQGKPQ